MINQYPLLLGWASVSLFEAGATNLATQYAWKEAFARNLQIQEQHQVLTRRPTGFDRPKFRSIPNGFSLTWDKLFLLAPTQVSGVTLTPGARWVLDVIWTADNQGADYHGQWYRRTFTGVVVEAHQLNSREVFEHQDSLNLRGESCVTTGGTMASPPPALTTPLAL